jgi:arylsulfatase A-like enzyme
MRVPFAAAALGFALAEAGVATNAARLAGLPVGACAAAGLGAATVMLSCLVPVLWGIDALLETRGGRALAEGLHRAVAAGGSLAFAWLWTCAWLGAGVALVLALGGQAMAHMSRDFGLALNVLATLAGSAVLMLIAAAAGHGLGRRLVPRSEREHAIDRALAALASGAGLAVAAFVLVEPRYAPAPLGAGVLAAAALFGPLRHVRARRRAAAGLAVSLVCVAVLERLPSSAAEVIAYRAPYAALALGSAQPLFDRDGDGAASRLLGGDCNDADAKVHPRARDLPENGVDENCSGRDAPRYAPPRSRRTPDAPEPPHDVVVIMLDALRPDRLSLAGYRRKTSPHIDALAREGTWFRNAYTTAPSTRFAMASLFTGRDVRRLRYRDTGGNNFVLGGGAPTVAKRLRKAGYRSTGYTVTYVMQHNRGVGQGFHLWTTAWPLPQWKQFAPKKAAVTTEAVLKELAASAPGQRLFLFAHYDCTHQPYRKYPPNDFGDSASDRYDSALAHCDAQIGRVLAALRRRPNWGRTAVFLVSDHGELFGEHGLRSHGNSLYEPDVRVALITRVPNTQRRVVDTPVQLHWVAPTVLELAGVRLDSDDDAQSLLPAILGTPLRQRPLFLFTELERGSVRYFASAVVDWPHKFIRDHQTGTTALYDVVADRAERHSLVDRQPKIAGRLSDLLDAYEGWAMR